MNMKLAARQMGSMRAVKESLKKGGGSDTQWIKNIPADGIVVRFLTEPEQWFGYYEYFDKENKTFVPMAEGEILPDGVRPSFRYLTNALDVEQDRVIPLKLPKTAANSLIIKYDKYETLLDRNYELDRHGEGLDTTYDVTPTGPSKIAIGKYDLIDLEDILVTARKLALGEHEGADEDEPFPETDIDNEVDDDDDDEPAFNDDDIGTAKSDDEVEYTEAELKKMSVRDLRIIALEFDIDPRGKTKDEVLDAIIDASEA